MRFHSLLYLVFLALTVLVAWSLPRRPRKAWLLVASLVFYASWHVKYVVLLASVGAIASLGGAFVDEASGRARRVRGAVVVTLLAAILGAFKYLDWAFEHLNFVAARFGGGPFLAPHWLLPLGVSFYTFEAIGYIVEVTRGKERRYGFFDFQLFLGFYPHLVAGPIMRAKELIPQFASEDWRPRRAQIVSGLQTLAIGLFLKNVVVDKFSWEVDAAFAQPIADIGWKDALSMAVGFAVQIYLDFSAYSRLAIGSAQLFGIELTENFNYPFRARNPADFWNRWHISLSRWIRDYLFFPLVGKRMRVSRMCWASIASMVLCGLWHGAGYTFILWGAYHGLLTAGYYVARWALGQWRKKTGATGDVFESRLGGVLSAAITWVLLLPTWILFRAANVKEAFQLIGILATPWSHFHHGGGFAKKPIALMIAIWLSPFVVEALEGRSNELARTRPVLFGLGRGALVGTALLFALLYTGSQTAFVYFQF